MTASRPAQALAVPVDLTALERWLDSAGVGSGPLQNVASLSGGTQNILVRFERDGASYVLRHPPRHKRPESEEVMRREIRLLRLLDDVAEGAAVPHARLVAADESGAHLGSACFVTTLVDGFTPGHGLPTAFHQRPDWQRDWSLDLVDVLAALASVPVDAAVAAGFRDPSGWLERQPKRWLEQLHSYPTDEFRAVGELLTGWLQERSPRAWRPGLIHGDYSLGNVLVDPRRPRVAAVLDWELVTLGEPLLDLAHLLLSWPVDNPGSVYAGLRAPGLPPVATLAQRYAERAGREITELDWYAVLACLRLGTLLEGTHARSLQQAAPTDVGIRLHALARSLFERAEAYVRGRAPLLT